jgi:protocatechuate 3,4-dioxygenase beta subunit
MRVWLPLLLFILSGALRGFQLPADAMPNPASVAGHTIEAKSGEPVKKALVILRKGNDREIGAYADSAGTFAFQSVEPGAYTISVEQDGYVPVSGAKPVTIILKPGDTETALVLKLQKTAVISGHVFDADGDPVTGAGIQIQPATQKKGQPRAGSTAITNDRGEYRAFGVVPGKYRISAFWTRALRHPTMSVQQAADLAGKAGEEAYAVTWYPGTLSATGAGIVQVESGAEVAGIDLQLRRMRAVRVRGIVTSSGAAPALVMISLQPAGGEGQMAQASVVSAGGRFEIGGVLPGSYILTADAVATDNPLAARRLVNVGETDLEGVLLTLAGPQVLKGRIVVPEGRKLPGLFVTLASREPQNHQGGGLAQPASDGSFTMPSVLAGDYDVILATNEPGNDLYPATVRMGDSDVLVDGLHVGEGALAELRITLKPNGATITCSVVSAGEDPLPEAQVMLIPDPPRQSAMALYGNCRTDATGSCDITGLAPGDYHAFAFASPAQPDFHDPETVSEFEKFGKSVKVTDGDRANVQLKAVREQD